MAKTIAVSDDVYILLKRVKAPGESFSDVIRRGLGQGIKLTDIYGAGTITKADWIKVRKTIRESEMITRKKLDKMFH